MSDIVECQFPPASTIAAQPRPMPADFCPDVVDMGESMVCQRANGQFVNMGFYKSGNPEADAKMVAALREQVWWTLEVARLGFFGADGRA